jgi:hypothetical protein
VVFWLVRDKELVLEKVVVPVQDMVLVLAELMNYSFLFANNIPPLVN